WQLNIVERAALRSRLFMHRVAPPPVLSWENLSMPSRKSAEKGNRQQCEITGERLPDRELVILDHLHPALVDRIRRDHSALRPDALVSRKQIDRYRVLYVEELIR